MKKAISLLTIMTLSSSILMHAAGPMVASQAKIEATPATQDAQLFVDHELVEDLLELNSLVLPTELDGEQSLAFEPLAPVIDKVVALPQESSVLDTNEEKKESSESEDPFELPEGYEEHMPSEAEMEEVFADPEFQNFFQSLMMASEDGNNQLFMQPQGAFEPFEEPIEK